MCVYVGDKTRQSLQNTPKATNTTVVDKNVVFVAKVYLLKAFFLSSSLSSSFLLKKDSSTPFGEKKKKASHPFEKFSSSSSSSPSSRAPPPPPRTERRFVSPLIKASKPTDTTDPRHTFRSNTLFDAQHNERL